MKKFIVISMILIFLPTFLHADIFEYVKMDDRVFQWEKVSRQDLFEGAVGFELKLTSQKWQDITWEHRLMIIKPKKLTNPSLCLLLITGSGRVREEILLLGVKTATDTGGLFAVLYDVPNQPLFDGLREDGLISYTFVKYLETRDKSWPLLFPMTKSAIKAMDAIQEFAEQELSINVSGFLTAGASKRGWTTWLTAVVDPRVKAIAPIVYDNLNLPGQMQHQINTWGAYSEKISDYTEKNLPQLLEKEEGIELSNLVDPYFYRDRITVPSLIIMGTNDRYWPLDALNIYYDGLIGKKYIFYGPNSGHGMEGNIVKVWNVVSAFFLKTAGQIKFPKVSWQYKEKDEFVEFSISTDTEIKPKKIVLWKAESPTRDFRDATWQEFDVTSKGSDYPHKIKRPELGFMAFLGETVYDFNGKEFSLSTNVYIINH